MSGAPEVSVLLALAGAGLVAFAQGSGLLQQLHEAWRRLGLPTLISADQGPVDQLLSRPGACSRIAEEAELLGCRALGFRLDEHALIDAGRSETFVDPRREIILSLSSSPLFEPRLRLLTVFEDGGWLQTGAGPGVSVDGAAVPCRDLDLAALLESHRKILAEARRAGRVALPVSDRAGVLRALALRSRHPLTRRLRVVERSTAADAPRRPADSAG